MELLRFRLSDEPSGAGAFREEVRAFLARELAHLPFHQRGRSWTQVDLEFTRKLGQQGWIGMTWPREYGGAEMSPRMRHILVEELLAAGAPVAAHWAADRQSGPLLLRFGTEEQRRTVLPRIAAGECYVCIGMSEPQAGSDLAAIQTTARPVEGGYVVNGSKIWTSGADRAHYMILLCRTEARGDSRHSGVSQLLLDMHSPGVEVQPILDISGRRVFNHVYFQDVFVPAGMLIGQEGGGWRQVTSELSLERSGPDRFLSSFVMLTELVRALGAAPADRATVAVGRLIAHIHTLRQMSLSVATMFEEGLDPGVQAACVKDLGATFEQEIPEIARLLVDAGDDDSFAEFRAALAGTQLIAPAYSLRGGTREILRGIIAKGLGCK